MMDELLSLIKANPRLTNPELAAALGSGRSAGWHSRCANMKRTA